MSLGGGFYQVIFGLLVASCGSVAKAQSLRGMASYPETLTVHYAVRPPYVVQTHSPKGDNPVEGLVASPVVQSLKKAGIPFRLVLTPTGRQIMLVKRNNGPDCTMGWFRNPSRESLGQFSTAVHRDGPMTLIVRGKADFVSPFSLESLTRRSMRLIVKDNFSYGVSLDKVLDHPQKLKVDRITAESDAMAKMVESGRADMMFAAREEAEYLISRFAEGSLRAVQISEVPKGEERYLFCSHRVSSTTLMRFNRALAQVLGKTP